MIRSLLNTFSTGSIILLFVGGTVVLAIGAVLIVRKTVPNVADGSFEDVVDGLRTVYELLFTIVLAFVIGAVLGTFSTAEEKVSSEATKLAQMVRASRDIAPEQRVVINSAIGAYVHAVADDEFLSSRIGISYPLGGIVEPVTCEDANFSGFVVPLRLLTMKNAEASPLASIALDNLYGVYHKYTPKPGEELVYETSLSALDEVTSMRRDRVLLSGAELPSLLRVLLILGLVILLFLEYRPKFPKVSSQLIHISFIAIVGSFAVLLTILLDYPFAGEVSVSNVPFMQGALAQFWPSP